MYYFAIGQKCPECPEKQVFPISQIVEIDGKPYGAFSVKCHACGWQPSEEEVIESIKEYLNDGLE